MKRSTRTLLDRAEARLRTLATRLSALLDRIFAIRPARAVMREQSRNLKRGLERRALEDTLDYIEQRMLHAPIFASRWVLLDHALELVAGQDGLVLEFGVAAGESINFIATRIQRSIYGFDSFDGLPENWGTEHRAGTFRQAGLPKVASNVTLVAGNFATTLPAFVARHAQHSLALAHIDCDLYTSTSCVLAALDPLLAPGTLLLFDEYFNYPGWRHHEFRAWQEFCEQKAIDYDYVGFAERGRQVLLRIVDRRSTREPLEQADSMT